MSNVSIQAPKNGKNNLDGAAEERQDGKGKMNKFMVGLLIAIGGSWVAAVISAFVEGFGNVGWGLVAVTVGGLLFWAYRQDRKRKKAEVVRGEQALLERRALERAYSSNTAAFKETFGFDGTIPNPATLKIETERVLNVLKGLAWAFHQACEAETVLQQAKTNDGFFEQEREKRIAAQRAVSDKKKALRRAQGLARFGGFGELVFPDYKQYLS